MQKWAATIILMIGAGLWAWRLMPSGAPTESGLRQTAGIGVQVITNRFTSLGAEVTCRVRNTTARNAAQVVLSVRLSDADGRLLGVNPLASISDLAGGKTRELIVTVPLQGSQADSRAEAQVSLVRWRK